MKIIDMNLADNTFQHLCCNDTVDIVIFKEKNNYIIKVLSLKNNDIKVGLEFIDFEEFKNLVE